MFKTIFQKSQIKQPNIRLLDVYESEFNFERAAQFGVIGLRTIEPKDLRKFIEGSNIATSTNGITTIIYKTWIIAMLKNQELLNAATELANWLIDYQTNSTKGTRNTRDQNVKEVLSAKRREQLLEAMITIAENDPSKSLFIQTAKDRIMKDIEQENIQLFVYLIKIDYMALKNQKS